MEWVKLLFEAAITFGATFGGVYVAIQADNKREAKTNHELKAKLLNGIYFEINRLKKYFRDNPSIVTFKDYSIDSPIILETVKDQFYRLDKDLIGPMADLRDFIRRTTEVCQLWTKRNRENVGKSQVSTEWASLTNNLRGEWNSLYTESKVILEMVTKLLEKEGAIPLK